MLHIFVDSPRVDEHALTLPGRARVWHATPRRQRPCPRSRSVLIDIVRLM